MFSKKEARSIRQEFWTSFGKSFPNKWLLYNTKIKGFAFKFEANNRTASVCLDIEHPDEIANELLFNQLLSLRKILEAEYLPKVIYDHNFELDNRKIIRRIYVPFDKKFSIYNKDTWQNCYIFFIETMPKFELFFHEYQDILKQTIS